MSEGVCYRVNAGGNIPYVDGPLGAINLITTLNISDSLKVTFENGLEVFVKEQVTDLLPFLPIPI